MQSCIHHQEIQVWWAKLLKKLAIAMKTWHSLKLKTSGRYLKDLEHKSIILVWGPHLRCTKLHQTRHKRLITRKRHFEPTLNHSEPKKLSKSQDSSPKLPTLPTTWEVKKRAGIPKTCQSHSGRPIVQHIALACTCGGAQAYQKKSCVGLYMTSDCCFNFTMLQGFPKDIMADQLEL